MVFIELWAIAWIQNKFMDTPFWRAAFQVVLGGALGNVIDRIVLGSVVDFIQVYIGSWPFPSFNVADAAITVGHLPPMDSVDG